jgi:hypothetical protein
MWDQGEKWHPGLKSLAESSLNLDDKSKDILFFSRHDHVSSSYCNYFLGDSFFWSSYSSFISSLDNEILHRDKLFSETTHTTHAYWYPFVFERIFPLFISQNQNLVFKAFPWRLNEILKRTPRNLLSRAFVVLVKVLNMVCLDRMRAFQFAVKKVQPFFRFKEI